MTKEEHIKVRIVEGRKCPTCGGLLDENGCCKKCSTCTLKGGKRGN